MNKKYIDDFVKEWCNKLKIPRIGCVLIKEKEMENETVTDTMIYLLKSITKDSSYCKYVLLHEIIHWCLYCKSEQTIFIDEHIVEVITNEIFQEFYLEDWNKLCSKNLI